MRSTEDLLRRVENLCLADMSARQLQEHLLTMLRERVRYDGHVFSLTDPVTRVATAPHADVPMLPQDRLPEVIRWRYLSSLNRWDNLQGRPARSLLTVTRSPEDSLVWRHVLREVGVVDTAMVVFGDRYGAWGYLELWRTSSPFTETELGVLTALVPAVTTGLRAAVARTFAHPTDGPRTTGAAVVLLDPDLVVRTQTEDAGAAFSRLLPPGGSMTPIPAVAYNVAAALLAQEHGVPVGEPWSRVHLGASHWMTARASRLGGDIAVSIEGSTPSERIDLFSRSQGLSPRESQVVALLGVGLDSREIAGQLFLSDHTVNDHVRAALAKSGARTRHVLLARATGSG